MRIKRFFLMRIALTILTMTILSGCSQLKGLSSTSATNESKAEAEETSDVSKDKQGVSSIFVQKNTDGTDDGFTKLLSLMQSNGVSFYKQKAADKGLISANDVVLLKVNSQWVLSKVC